MVTYSSSKSLVDLHSAYECIKSIRNYYPNFDDWYVNKMIPDVIGGDGVLILAREKDTVVGVGLGRSGNVPKLRCIRVDPMIANRGIGLHIIDRLLTSLNASKPVVTVSEEMMHTYSRIFVNRYDFSLTNVEKGMYRKGKIEYVFNDNLKREIQQPTPYGLY